MSILFDTAERDRRHIQRVPREDARSFLLRHGYNSSSILLPEYYRASGFEDMALVEPDWGDRRPVLALTSPIPVLAPKGQIGWRRYSLLHPYAYWQLARGITNEDAWPQFQAILSSDSPVASYTIPTFETGRGRPSGQNISKWLRFAEADLIADAAHSTHLGATDIENFYPSVYTHSLSWAMHGKAVAKRNRGKYADFPGNRLDRLFQAANDGQTNGIPIGTLASDVAAEILLVDTDRRLAPYIGADCVASRFRDDYRVLAPSYHDAKKFLDALSRDLHSELSLSLNADKTHISSDIIDAAFRSSKRDIEQNIPIQRLFHAASVYKGRDLKIGLIATHQLQVAHPSRAVATSILSRLNRTIEQREINLELRIDDARTCVSILAMIVRLREDTAPHVVILADKILSKFGDDPATGMLEYLHTEFTASDTREFLEVWLYRLARHRFPAICSELIRAADNPLLNMLSMSRPHYMEFPVSDQLTPDDLEQLERFSFVDAERLTSTEEQPLHSSLASPWRGLYA